MAAAGNRKGWRQRANRWLTMWCRSVGGWTRPDGTATGKKKNPLVFRMETIEGGVAPAPARSTSPLSGEAPVWDAVLGGEVRLHVALPSVPCWCEPWGTPCSTMVGALLVSSASHKNKDKRFHNAPSASTSNAATRLASILRGHMLCGIVSKSLSHRGACPCRAACVGPISWCTPAWTHCCTASSATHTHLHAHSPARRGCARARPAATPF